MRSIKLTIAYDGTAYAGWQVQSGRKTVQEVLETALGRITGEAIRVTASGRTDAGVHALGQVVSFCTSSRLPAEVLRRALNANLPRDVAVLEVAEAPEGFDANRRAVRKRYRYVIHDGPVRDVFARRYCWHCSFRLDMAAMDRAARPLLGRHDFASFETRGSERVSTVRTIYDIRVCRGAATDLSPAIESVGRTFLSDTSVGRTFLSDTTTTDKNVRPTDSHLRRVDGDVVAIEIEADGFLYNMVRAIVGTLVEVGRGARSEAWVAEVLEAKDRRVAGRTAPPQGLFLVRVEYRGNDE